jgi:hypothetical protein
MRRWIAPSAPGRLWRVRRKKGPAFTRIRSSLAPQRAAKHGSEHRNPPDFQARSEHASGGGISTSRRPPGRHSPCASAALICSRFSHAFTVLGSSPGPLRRSAFAASHTVINGGCAWAGVATRRTKQSTRKVSAMVATPSPHAPRESAAAKGLLTLKRRRRGAEKRVEVEPTQRSGQCKSLVNSRRVTAKKRDWRQAHGRPAPHPLQFCHIKRK